MNFMEKYRVRADKTGSRLVVGIDPVLEKMPSGYGSVERIFPFFERIIDETHDIVVGYKPNIAFFEQYGPSGLVELEKVAGHITEKNAVLILDAKRGDIGNTNRAYAKEIFEHYKADATTLNPLLGFPSLQEFFEYGDKYMFVLNYTSNPSSGQFFHYGAGKPLYQEISDRISEIPNCGAVAGATKLRYLSVISRRVGDSIILIPGIGAQGGSIESSIKAVGEDKFIFNASRSIIYASDGDDYPRAARDKVLEINEAVTNAMEKVL